jgi:hypothetical protein
MMVEENKERENFITDAESAKFVQIMEDNTEKQKMVVSNFMSVGDINLDEKITKKQWVEFGDKNLFPKELIEINIKSSKSFSILKNISNMVKGNGFIETQGNSLFLTNPNGRDSINDILDKVSLDFVISGYFCLNIIWSRDGKKIAKIKHIPFEKVRLAKKELEDESDDESIDDYYISDDWSNTKKYEPQFIKGYDPSNTKSRSQLLMVKKNIPGLEYYTLPHYIGALNWIRLDAHISEYHLNNAANGYFPSILMNIATGIPSEEKQRIIKKRLDEMFQGTKNAGSMVLTFSEGKEQGPEIIPLNLSDSDKKFLEVENLVLDNILIANNITNPQLVGIKIAGQLGGTQELVESFKLLQINLINSFQKIIEQTFSDIFYYHINGGDEKLVIDELKYKDEKIIQQND